MWRVEYWTISGIHTGWRVVRGSGWDMEVAEGFSFDRHVVGDYKAKKETAHVLCRRLNLGVERAAA